MNVRAVVAFLGLAVAASCASAPAQEVVEAPVRVEVFGAAEDLIVLARVSGNDLVALPTLALWRFAGLADPPPEPWLALETIAALWGVPAVWSPALGVVRFNDHERRLPVSTRRLDELRSRPAAPGSALAARGPWAQLAVDELGNLGAWGGAQVGRVAFSGELTASAGAVGRVSWAPAAGLWLRAGWRERGGAELGLRTPLPFGLRGFAAGTVQRGLDGRVRAEGSLGVPLGPVYLFYSTAGRAAVTYRSGAFAAQAGRGLNGVGVASVTVGSLAAARSPFTVPVP